MLCTNKALPSYGVYCVPSRVYLYTEPYYCCPHGKSPNFQIRDQVWYLISDWSWVLTDQFSQFSTLE